MASDDYRDKLPLKGHVMDERGQYYVINKRERRREDRKLTAQITCSHVMFKLADYKFPYASYISEAYGIPLSTLTAAISAATGDRFTISVDDTFDLADVKDFGRGNCLEALNAALTLYGAEIEPDNFTLHVRKKIGTASPPQQFRLAKNIVSATLTDDSASLCTRLFAEMKDSRTWIGQPASILTPAERARLEAVPGAIVDGKLAVNYLISPDAGVWASDSVPYFDDTLREQDVTDPLKLLEAARKRLAERQRPLFEVSVSAADIHKLPYSTEIQPGLGDAATFVDDELGMTGLSGRIVQLTEYPYALDQHAQITVANVMTRDYTQIIADLETSRREVDNVFSGGRIRADVFEEFARAAVIDVNASKTQVKYDQRGIVLQSTADAKDLVLMTANGIIVSTDGGAMARTAITAAGVAAEQVVGQLGSFVSLVIGSGNNVVKVNTNGISAGHDNYSLSPFKLDMAGNLTANKLTANYANIADSSFNGGQIVGSSINVGNGKFTVNTAGDLYTRGGVFADGSITGSSINVGNGRFTVNSAGTMSATNGNFSGNISASTIRGSLVETRPSGQYPRAFLSTAGDYFGVESTAENWIRINSLGSTGLPLLEFRSEGGLGQILQDGAYLNIMAPRRISVSGTQEVSLSSSGSIVIDAFGGTTITRALRVSSFSNLSDSNGTTLTSLIDQKASPTTVPVTCVFNPDSRLLKFYNSTGDEIMKTTIPAS